MNINILRLIISTFFSTFLLYSSLIGAVSDCHFAELIPQRFFRELPAIKRDGSEVIVSQRDCVENLVRNVLNMALLDENGDMRPGVEEKISGGPLGEYYRKTPLADRISSSPESGLEWLKLTTGHEYRGVEYWQHNREVGTGVDNILALMEALMPKWTIGGEDRRSKIESLCEYLSTEIKINLSNKGDIQNIADIILKFEHKALKKHLKVRLFINAGHVSMRFRDTHIC